MSKGYELDILTYTILYRWAGQGKKKVNYQIKGVAPLNFEIAFGENFIKCVSISTSAVYQRCICVLLIQQTGKYLF